MGLTFLDFFAGIGGFRLGMQQAGHTPVGWVEWDKFARKSYEAIHKPEGEWTAHDIRSVDYRDMPRADVWTFGFPCQDISVAGNQKGFSGDRSSLFFSVTRLLRQTKEWDSERLPSYLFIENVKNFLSVNDGWDFLAAQIELDEIGYECEWDVLNSKDFGVPQNRERVFIIGHLRGRSTRKVFPLGSESGGTFEVVGRLDPKVIVVGNTNPPGKGLNGQVFDSNGLAPTLTTNKGEGNRILVRKIGHLESDSGQTGAIYSTDGIAPTVLKQHGNAVIKILENGSMITDDGPGRKIRLKKDITPALRAHGGGSTPGIWVPKNFRIRKLTPRECFRLQGFPDWAFDRATAVNSDSQLYKQAGNSVTVDVIFGIASQFEIAAEQKLLNM